MKFNIDTIIRTVEEVVRERIERLGVVQSGAFEYYERRLENGTLFAEDDRCLADWIAANYSTDVTIFEVGAGIGTLSLYLTSYGFRSVAMDGDYKRFNMSLAVQSALARACPGLEKMYLPELTHVGNQSGIYQDMLSGRRVAVIGNLVNSWVNENKKSVFAGLSHFDELIFTPARFGASRPEDKFHEVFDLLSGLDIGPCSIPNVSLPFYRVRNLSRLRQYLSVPDSCQKPDVSSADFNCRGKDQLRELLSIARDSYKAAAYSEAIEWLDSLLVQARTGGVVHQTALFFLIKSKVALKKLSPAEIYPLTLMAVKTYPDHRDFQLLHARSCRDTNRLLDQFRFYKNVARLDPQNLEAIWGMASVLSMRKKFAMAAKLFDLIDLANCPYRQVSFAASESYLMTEQLEKADQAIKIAKAILPNDSRTHLYEAVLSAKLAHRKLSDTALGIRHIAICGPSYVGSTIFGVMLGALDQVENIGESNWLIRRKGSDDRAQIIDFDQDLENVIPYCRTHRRITHDCVEMSFRRALAQDPTNFYKKIADYLDAEILVTSEKNLSNYWQGDPLWRFDQVVLFKHPVLQMQSVLNNLNKKRKNAEQRGSEKLDLVNQMTFWARSYLGILGNMRPKGRRLVLNWEQFCNRPHDHMRIICDKLNLTYRDDFLDNVSINHLFGGNDGINLERILTTGRIEVRKARQPEFTEYEKGQILFHTEGARVFGILQRLYEKDFSGLNSDKSVENGLP